VRDLKRALSRQQTGERSASSRSAGSGDREKRPVDDDDVFLMPPRRMESSSSLPALVEVLHPEIGRPTDIAQPGGFRRDHLQREGLASSVIVRRPLLPSRSMLDKFLDPRVRNVCEDERALIQGLDQPTPRSPDVHGVVRGSSDWQTALLILKSTVGGTLIVVPEAYKGAGLISASMVMILIAGIEIYCMSLLIRCSVKIGGGSYGQIMERCLGRKGLWAVDVSLVTSQLGFVCTEILYVATNLPDALAAFKSTLPAWMLLTQTDVLFGQMILAVPMAWIRHLKYFALTNVLANVTVLSALGTLLAFAIKGLARDGPAEEIHNFGPQWLLFAGTSVFSFECINFVIPMYEAHEKKETFVPILTKTLWAVVVLFILFGGLNYMRYGEATVSPVTKNFAESLSSSSPLGRIMQFAFAFASLLNVPLFLFPASIAIEDKIFKGQVPGCAAPGLVRKWSKNMLRTILVFCCTLIAYLGAAHINALVAIIGSVCCVPLAFIYPVICHYVLLEPGPVAAALSIAIGTMGAFLFVLTTVSAIQDWQ